MLLIGPLEIKFSEILIEINTFFFQENAFETVVCEKASIFSRPQCVKLLPSRFRAEQGALISTCVLGDRCCGS